MLRKSPLLDLNEPIACALLTVWHAFFLEVLLLTSLGIKLCKD